MFVVTLLAVCVVLLSSLGRAGCCSFSVVPESDKDYEFLMNMWFSKGFAMAFLHLKLFYHGLPFLLLRCLIVSCCPITSVIAVVASIRVAVATYVSCSDTIGFSTCPLVDEMLIPRVSFILS